MKVKDSQSQKGDRMARLSDIIEEFIKQLFEESDDGILEIQRMNWQTSSDVLHLR